MLKDAEGSRRLRKSDGWVGAWLHDRLSGCRDSPGWGVGHPIRGLPHPGLWQKLLSQLDLARFTGRTALIEKIDAAVHRITSSGATSGYVLIRGEAGVGKTALAAYLSAHRLRPLALPLHLAESLA
jgi:hypothetical protein